MADPDPFAFLFGLERLGMKFGLENIAALCEALGHPERSFPAILIAGTNGKGSVTVMVETALRAAGLRAARYTSPHLVRLEERFVVDGEEVTTAALAAAIGEVQSAVARLIAGGALEGPPTFFECATAAAFTLFSRARIDIAVLEVGLGGRLDATNVVTPIATAITSIDFDHQAQLGDTIEAIAAEKAGIIKPGVPIVSGPLPSAAEDVVRQTAAGCGAPFIRARDTVRIVKHPPGPAVSVRTARWTLDDVEMALPGEHQLDNAAVAVALLETLAALGMPIDAQAVRTGLTRAVWPARLERFARGSVAVLLDAAHNPAGARALASHLEEIGWRDITLVLGVMRDKDVRGIIEPLAPFCASIVCTTAPSPRALPAAEIAAAVRSAGAQAEIVEDPEAALQRAVVLGRPVVAAGSIFLIGPLRDILR